MISGFDVTIVTCRDGVIKLPKYFRGKLGPERWVDHGLVSGNPFSRHSRMPPSMEITWV